MLSSLRDVVAPISVSEFLQSFWDKKRLHIKAADPARAESLLPWHDIEALISMRSFENIEVLKNGMAIPPQLYQTENMGAFHDLFAQGASIALKEIYLHVPQLQMLATSIERQMGFPVGINAYFSFAKGGAFKPHWDRHDVLVIQVHGRKQWRVWDSTFKSPVEKSSGAKHEITVAPSEELELLPGDVLYVPRGEPHAAQVSGGASVHLTIGLDVLNGMDLLGQLNHAAGGDEFVRGDIPVRTSEAHLHDYEAELKARLHRLVDALDVSQFLKEQDLNRRPIRAVSLCPIEAPSDVVRLTLRRRVPLPEGVGVEPAPVTIGGAEYVLSPAAIDILGHLFENDGQPRQTLLENLSSRQSKTAVTAGLRELLRLGFLAIDRAV